MTVRARLALTILLTGLVTALAVIVTVAAAFQRFQHESTWERANGFIGRVVASHPDLLELHARDPQGFAGFLRNLLLFEPDSQLYLLGADGTVLASSGSMPLAPGLKVKLGPVQEAVMVAGDRARAAYVMGDDPQYMAEDTVIAARMLHASTIAPGANAGGYLYLVCQKRPLPPGQIELLGSTVAGPALAGILAVVLLGALIAAWIIGTVTRPLRALSDAVDAAARDGFEAPAPQAALPAAPPAGDDEFARLRSGFGQMLGTLRAQWDRLQRLDRFRREGVSNLSHDLRSPLTATTACLETLQARWADDPTRADDRALLGVALRNTGTAAGMVRALGDFALLDEPSYRLQPVAMDAAELIDDLARRFAGRAAQQGVTLSTDTGDASLPARLDVELFERALANLLDNALRFTPAGGRIVLHGALVDGGLQVQVQDSGCGIAPEDLPHLFERFYRKSEGGHGLGLAIVARIVALHGGHAEAASTPGQGTTVTLHLPAPD
jgi:signal transduction histidine kinase